MIARGAPGRDIVVAVRSREILRAEQILEIDLRLDAVRQLVKQRRIDACIGGQLHRVADRRVRFRARDHAEASANLLREVVSVPQREAVARHQRHFATLRDERRTGGDRIDDLRFLQRVAGGNQPTIGDAALQAELESAAALRSREHHSSASIRIGRARVAAVEPINGRGGEQPLDRLPFTADLIIVETLGL